MAGRTPIIRCWAVLCLLLACCVASPPALGAQQPDPDAFVYILNLGIRNNKIVYKGLRVGFAVGDGRTILTAAHCVEDFANGNHSLFQPLVISRYYGDLFEAEIVDTDDPNDIALLKPTWNSHPGLRIDTSNRWKNAGRIVIAGYRPSDLAQGSGTRVSRRISLKKENVVRTNGEGRYALQLGSIRYSCKGWSGSAFVLPDSGEVVGVLSNERYVRKFLLKRHYVFGCNPEAIHRLFRRNKNNLSLSAPSSPIARRDCAKRFDSILQLFDSILIEDKETSRKNAKELCEICPDSYILHILAAWMLDAPEDEEYFTRAIELAGERAFPHAVYGSYLLNRARYKKALRQFDSTLVVDPNHVFALTGRIVALTQTNPAEAEMQARELAAKWPSNGGFWFELSRTLRKQRKYDQELPIIRKAVSLPHPKHLEHLYQRHLADSLANNEQYPEAEQTYKTVLEDHPCARCWSAYASLLIRIGDERAEDARKALANVETMNNDNDVPKATIREFETAVRKMIEPPSAGR
ncbi:MAG: trypsin-like peptidase domain-containing protein [Phycisphaerales bacterium]|nr:MAG: trypsin-like peptidase domain-containing protein [Phycisphaerales bacterium]